MPTQKLEYNTDCTNMSKAKEKSVKKRSVEEEDDKVQHNAVLDVMLTG